jgi:hypothetical protein
MDRQTVARNWDKSVLYYGLAAPPFCIRSICTGMICAPNPVLRPQDRVECGVMLRSHADDELLPSSEDILRLQRHDNLHPELNSCNQYLLF